MHFVVIKFGLFIEFAECFETLWARSKIALFSSSHFYSFWPLSVCCQIGKGQFDYVDIFL